MDNIHLISRMVLESVGRSLCRKDGPFAHYELLDSHATAEAAADPVLTLKVHRPRGDVLTLRIRVRAAYDAVRADAGLRHEERSMVDDVVAYLETILEEEIATGPSTDDDPIFVERVAYHDKP